VRACRCEILTNRALSQLRKAQDRLHLVHGYLTAMARLDDVVQVGLCLIASACAYLCESSHALLSVRVRMCVTFCGLQLVDLLWCSVFSFPC